MDRLGRDSDTVNGAARRTHGPDERRNPRLLAIRILLPVAFLTLLLAGCRDILTDPAPAGPASLALSMVMPEGTPAQTTQSETGLAMSPGAAFDQADQIRIQLRGEAGTRVDVEQAFHSQGSETRVRLEVDLDVEEEVVITLALLRQGAPLFEGEGTVTLEPGEQSSVVLELRGIVAGVELETGLVEFDALGDRESLSARAVFATGQTVPGATASWTSRNPSVARIVGGTQVEAVSEGETELVARVGSHEAWAAVRIRQRVAEVRPSPASVEVVVGESRSLSVTLRDRNGHGISASGRTVAWTSSNESVATVNGAGQVTGVSEGTATLRATAEGVSGQVAVTVTDPQPPTITTTALPDGTVGQSYSATLEAEGGETPYTWSVASGTLPAGLSLSSAGMISGTPTTVQTRTFTVRVTGANELSATRQYRIEIEPAPEPPTITTSSLPDGMVGESYSATLEAEGGETPYTWTVSAGRLPPGLSLSSAGVISGTPTTAGNRTFTVRVRGADGLSSTRAYTVEVEPGPEPPSITTRSLPDGTVGESYSAMLRASGGEPPYVWAQSGGRLPAGLSLSAAGEISGTPTTAESRTFTVRVTGANELSSTRTFRIEILSSGEPLFQLTSDQFPFEVAGDSQCRAEFGNSYRMADWEDIRTAWEAGVDPDEILTDSSGWVTRDGQFQHTGERHYFATRFPVGSNFAVFGNIGDVFALGSWWNDRAVLCFNPAGSTSEP